MVTVINNPPSQTPSADTSNNGMGFLLGGILLLIFAIFFFVYLLPRLGNTIGGMEFNIPNRFDINVHQAPPK